MNSRKQLSNVTGSFCFAVEGLCLARDTLGTKWGPVGRNDYLLWLLLPSEDAVEETGDLWNRPELVSVSEFTIEIKIDLSEPIVLPYEDGLPQDDPSFNALHDQLETVASLAARDFLAWVQFERRQYWLEPVSRPVILHSMLTGPEFLGAGSMAVMPRGVSPLVMLITQHGEEFALSPDTLGRSIEDVLSVKPGIPGSPRGRAAAIDAQFPERLLGSAIRRLWVQYPDPQVAVFLAALACEVKIKFTLRNKVQSAQRPFLDLIIDNPRDVTITALQHFGEVCKVVTGVSLRESDKALWKRLTVLIEARNNVAHRGFEPSVDESIEHLHTAAEVFRWLRKL